MSTNELALAVRSPSSASESQSLAIATRGANEHSALANQQRALAIAALGPQIEPFLNDPALDKVAQFMFSVTSFIASYQHCQQYIDETDENMPLKPVGGKDVPEDLQHDTVKTLGEKLFLKLNGQACAFCQAWCCIQDMLVKDGLSAAFKAIEMQEDLCEDDSDCQRPLAAEEMLTLLNAKQINKAVKRLQIVDNGTVSMGEMFLLQINNRQQASGQVKALVDAVTQTSQQLSQRTQKLEGLEVDKSRCDAVVEDAKTQKTMLEELGRVEDSTSKYLEQQLQIAKARKAEYEADEKQYTYRMYGAWVNMWRNDVDLAKQKVKDYEQKIQQIEAQLRECTKEKSASIKKQIVETNTQHIREAECQAAQAVESIRRTKINIDNLEKKLALDQLRLERLVRKDGKFSVQHLLQANEAKEMLARVTCNTESTSDVFACGWQKELGEISILMAKCLEAKKLPTQKKILQKLLAHITSEKPLFQILRHSRPLMSLMPTQIDYQPSYQPRQLAGASEVEECSDCGPSPDVTLLPDCQLDSVRSMLLEDDLQRAMEASDTDHLHSLIAEGERQPTMDNWTPNLKDLFEKAKKEVEARTDAINRLEECMGGTDLNALETEIKKTKERCCKVSILVKAEAQLKRRQTALKEQEELALKEQEELEKARKELQDRTAGPFQPPARIVPQQVTASPYPVPIDGAAMMDDDDETEGL